MQGKFLKVLGHLVPEYTLTFSKFAEVVVDSPSSPTVEFTQSGAYQR